MKKYGDKVENALLYLRKKQVEKFIVIDQKMKLQYMEDLVKT